MPTSQVAVLGTGGTIASTDGEDGATPSKNGEDLIEAVPELDMYADISGREVVHTPSFALDTGMLPTIAEGVRASVADGAEGIVITHGTDTMEETAYYLDLVLDLDVPVVLTGAQRRPDELGSDGPKNMLTAVRAAVHDRVQSEGGVYIAFDEELHAARDVTKRHTRDLSTFISVDACPIATFTRENIQFHRQPGSYSATIDATRLSKDIVMVKSAIGVDGQQVHRVLDSVDGIVVEGTGLGNTTSELGDAVGDATDANIPVVITSRCLAGTVAPVYGTQGGGRTLADHGVIAGDNLPSHKARIKLALLMQSLGDDIEELRAAFER